MVKNMINHTNDFMACWWWIVVRSYVIGIGMNLAWLGYFFGGDSSLLVWGIEHDMRLYFQVRESETNHSNIWSNIAGVGSYWPVSCLVQVLKFSQMLIWGSKHVKTFEKLVPYFGFDIHIHSDCNGSARKFHSGFPTGQWVIFSIHVTVAEGIFPQINMHVPTCWAIWAIDL